MATRRNKERPVKTHLNPTPLFPELAAENAKAASVVEQRGIVVSALMKSIRLRRDQDAVFWMMALLRAGVDRGYLGRRCFGSACEDNLSLGPIELGSELARRPSRSSEWPYFRSVLASCRGLKWYQLIGTEYILTFCNLWEEPRSLRSCGQEEILQVAAQGIQARDVGTVIRAHRELHERRRGCFDFLERLLHAAVGRETAIQRLAAICARHKYYLVTFDMNATLQLIWTVCKGPFCGCEDPVPTSDLTTLVKQAHERWQLPKLEPVPTWACDGVHTIGSDGRFAGSWPGIRNMVEMYRRYGRLDPADPGVLIR
jgi:hypothetical protein